MPDRQGAIILTRPEADNAELAALLAARGLRTLQRPLTRIELRPPAAAELEAWNASASELAAFAFTSRHGVSGYFHARADVLSAPAICPIAVVGHATARAVEAMGFVPALVAEKATGESLALMLAEQTPPRSLIGWAHGEEVRAEFAEMLTTRGFRVLGLTVYAARETEPEPIEEPVAAAVIASPRHAALFFDRYPELRAACFVALGPTCARALRELGAAQVVESRKEGAAGLAEAVCDWLDARPEL